MESSNLTVCIPTLNRYDALYDLLISIKAGSLIPKLIYIIDNGGKFDVEKHIPYENKNEEKLIE